MSTEYILIRAIEKQYKISLERGRAKYRFYFIDSTMFSQFKNACDAEFIRKGMEDVIVTGGEE